MIRLDVVALGEPMYEFSQLPNGSGHWLQGFGGDTMNCALAAARQGTRVAYITRLGHPPVRLGGEPDAARRVAARADPGARFFHTSGITQAISPGACDAAFAAMEAAREAGVRVAYDADLRLRLWPATRARAVIAAAIALSDVFLLSVDEAPALCDVKEPESILAWCHGRGARSVALKLGQDGVIGSDGSRHLHIHGHVVHTVDATGAGDCFAGSLMTRLAAGDDFWTSLRYANAATALATTGYGAVAPLPRPDAVLKLLSQRDQTTRSRRRADRSALG